MCGDRLFRTRNQRALNLENEIHFVRDCEKTGTDRKPRNPFVSVYSQTERIAQRPKSISLAAFRQARAASIYFFSASVGQSPDLRTNGQSQPFWQASALLAVGAGAFAGGLLAPALPAVALLALSCVTSPPR